MLWQSVDVAAVLAAEEIFPTLKSPLLSVAIGRAFGLGVEKDDNTK